MKHIKICFTIILLSFPSAKVHGSVTLKFDASYPQSSRSIVERYHRKITGILEQITGVKTSKIVLLIYNPTVHRGFRDNYRKLIDPYLPGGTRDWFWWYLVEISHFYVPSINICKNNAGLCKEYERYFNPYMAFREHEYISHAIAEYVIVKFLNQSEEFRTDIALYKNQEKAWLNPMRYLAIKEISPQTIFQIDTNYNNFNSLACDVAGSMFFKLESTSPGFFKNFFSKILRNKITTISEYIEAITSSISVDKIDGIDKKKWVENHPYFARFHSKNFTKYSLDVFLFSPFKENTYPWHRLTYVNPQYFIVSGSSKRFYKPGSYPITKPDPDLFEREANFTIVDETGKVVYQGKALISKNLWSNVVYLPNLAPGKYYIKVSFNVKEEIRLKKVIYFYITGKKNLYDDTNNLLIVKGLRYGCILLDLVLKFRNGWFDIIYATESADSIENGIVFNMDSIILRDVLIINKFYTVVMGYNNGSLYFKRLL